MNPNPPGPRDSINLGPVADVRTLGIAQDVHLNLRVQPSFAMLEGTDSSGMPGDAAASDGRLITGR